MIYTAITIGPIYNTLISVKSTKAIWAASYLFSWLMKSLLQSIPENDLRNILMPYLPDQATSTVRAGLLPDRCIVKGGYGEAFEKKREEIIQDLAQQISDNLKNRYQPLEKHKPGIQEEVTFKEIQVYLSDYLRMDIIQVALEPSINPIFEINTLLDSQELFELPLDELKVDYLNQFFEIVYYNFLVKEKFRGDHKYFPSTAEISTYGFKQEVDYGELQQVLRKTEGPGQNEEAAAKSQLDFYKNVRDQFPNHFRNHHKYLAIVQADGDNMGKVISAIYDYDDKQKAEEYFKLFSEQLFKFTSQSVQLIQRWDAVPVYGGGDDLLFFAPVAKPIAISESTKETGIIKETIFDLLDRLDGLFNELILDYKGLQPVMEKLNNELLPSLSFGMSIGYYKYPLNKSLIKGANLLFGVAKGQPGKNSTAFEIIKHSGQHFGTAFNKSSGTYKAFRDMVRPHGDKQFIPDETLLRGIAHKLETLSASIMALADKETEISGNKEPNNIFQNLFENHFDEAIHRDEDNLNPFLLSVLALLEHVYKDTPVNSGAEGKSKDEIHEANIQKLYASLRFVSFIHNKEDRDEF